MCRLQKRKERRPYRRSSVLRQQRGWRPKSLRMWHRTLVHSLERAYDLIWSREALAHEARPEKVDKHVFEAVGKE